MDTKKLLSIVFLICIGIFLFSLVAVTTPEEVTAAECTHDRFFGQCVSQYLEGLLENNFGPNEFNVVTSGNATFSYYCNTTNCYSVADFLLDTNTGNTSAQMIAAVNGTALNGTNFTDIATYNSSYDSQLGHNTTAEIWAVIDNGTFMPAGGSTGNTSAEIQAAVNSTEGWVNVTGDNMTGQLTVNATNNISKLTLWSYSNTTDPPALTGDIIPDCEVDIYDFAILGECYGCTSADPCWYGCDMADLSGNNQIDVFDLATVGLNYGHECQTAHNVFNMEVGNATGQIWAAYTDVGNAFGITVDNNATFIKNVQGDLDFWSVGGDIVLRTFSGGDIVMQSSGAIRPVMNGTMNFGTPEYQYNDMYLSGDIYMHNGTIRDNVTVCGTLSGCSPLQVFGGIDLGGGPLHVYDSATGINLSGPSTTTPQMVLYTPTSQVVTFILSDTLTTGTGGAIEDWLVNLSLLPYLDDTHDLGDATHEWDNVYANTYHGDGSQLTGIAGITDIYVNESGDTMTGNLNVNANLTVDSSVLHVDSLNNRVGIGTTAPSGKLNIEGATADIELQSTGASNQTWVEFYSLDGREWIIGMGPSDGANRFEIGEYQSGAWQGVRLAIQDGTGNVGIGTSNPQQKLDVVGSVNATLALFSNVTSCTQALETDASGQIVCGTDETGAGTSGPWVAGANTIYNSSSGLKVGIGDATPDEALDITGNISFNWSNGGVKIYPEESVIDVDGAFLLIQAGNATNYDIGVPIGGDLILEGGDGTESDGNVYVGARTDSDLYAKNNLNVTDQAKINRLLVDNTAYVNGTINVTGNTFLLKHLYMGTPIPIWGAWIYTNTTDGNDNSGLLLSSANSIGRTRGANIEMFGNEYALFKWYGDLILTAGDGDGGANPGDIRFMAGGANRAYVSAGGLTMNNSNLTVTAGSIYVDNSTKPAQQRAAINASMSTWPAGANYGVIGYATKSDMGTFGALGYNAGWGTGNKYYGVYGKQDTGQGAGYFLGNVTVNGNMTITQGDIMRLKLQNADTGYTAGDGFQILMNQNEHAYIINYENKDLFIGTNGATRLFIDNGGYIGIQDTTPSVELDVAGDVRADSYIEYSSIFRGNALEGLKGIEAEGICLTEWCDVKHDTLPDGVYVEIQAQEISHYESVTEEKCENETVYINQSGKITEETITTCKNYTFDVPVYVNVTEEGRDLGNFAQVVAKGVLENDENITALKEEIAALKAELCKHGSYTWCIGIGG